MTDGVCICVNVAVGTLGARVSSISLRETRRLGYDGDVVVRQSVCERFIAHGTGLRCGTGCICAKSMSSYRALSDATTGTFLSRRTGRILPGVSKSHTFGCTAYGTSLRSRTGRVCIIMT